MPSRNQQIDAYIAGVAPFARPILEHLRGLVHQACPQVEESIKWRAPHFGYRGMLCNMAAFKQHCAFGFWKGARFTGEDAAAVRRLDRITALADLPDDATVLRLIGRAVALNEAGETAPSRPKPPARPPIPVPDDLQAALAGKAEAQRAFDGFSPSHRREYIEWLYEAKTEATRGRRLAQALEWISEGKSRYWKYAGRK